MVRRDIHDPEISLAQGMGIRQRREGGQADSARRGQQPWRPSAPRTAPRPAEAAPSQHLSVAAAPFSGRGADGDPRGCRGQAGCTAEAGPEPRCKVWGASGRTAGRRALAAKEEGSCVPGQTRGWRRTQQPPNGAASSPARRRPPHPAAHLRVQPSRPRGPGGGGAGGCVSPPITASQRDRATGRQRRWAVLSASPF